MSIKSNVKNLTGKYRKPKNLTQEQAIKRLEDERKENTYDDFDDITVERLAIQHFASQVFNGSFSDGSSYHVEMLDVTVDVSFPKMYKLVYKIETHDSMDDSFDDEKEELTENSYILADIKALWNCEQNVFCIQSNEDVKTCSKVEKLDGYGLMFAKMNKSLQGKIKVSKPELPSSNKNIQKLLKKFKTKPEVVSEEMFRCILAY